MAKQRSNIVAVLDLGSSKVVCFIARLLAPGKIEVLGIGSHHAGGMKAGLITDIKAAENSIIHAVEAAEKMAGENIQRVFVSISSNNLLSHRLNTEINVAGHEINERDINKLLFQALERYNDQSIEVIHSLPYDYMLDGNRGIDSPLGMYGNKLCAGFHIISAQTSALLNIASAAARCQIEVESYISASYATGKACLTPDEMQLGVTLIELGGGCSAISVFKDGNLIFTDGIPLGGINVTNDIARGLSTDFISAERVKNLYGNLISTSLDIKENIEVPISADEDSEMNVVSKKMLIEIIRARVEEILEILKQKLQDSGVEGASGNKVVITGGASQLAGMRELVSYMFTKAVRVGYPKTLEGIAESTSGVPFASTIGMLLYIASNETMADAFRTANSNNRSFLGNVVSWLKQSLS
jgi:cell division protein FtsA